MGKIYPLPSSFWWLEHSFTYSQISPILASNFTLPSLLCVEAPLPLSYKDT